MRFKNVFSVLSLFGACLMLAGIACESPDGSAGDKRADRAASAPVVEQPVTRTAMTAENNPTTLAGRGVPDLGEFTRLASWVYIDGQGGKFIEKDGKPQIQWITQGTVGSSPTFRVEAYEPLLGLPGDFACTLDTVNASDGSRIAYAIKADAGSFSTGKTYSLLAPGDNFTIRNRETGDVVSEIGSLVSGTYLLAAKVYNGETEKESLAITEFTVGE